MAEKAQLAKRLFVSAILSTISLYTIFAAPNWFFVLVVEIFVIMSMTEYFNLAEKSGLQINRYLGLTFAVLFPLSYSRPAESLIFMVAVLCIFIFNFHRRLKDQALLNTAVTLFGLLYVAWFFSFMTKIRWLENGSLWIFYTLLVVKVGDAGAYFVGKKFGKHKLIVHISPNKSIEGAVAGLITSIVCSVLSKSYLPGVDAISLFYLGIVIGILAQLGDLAESLIKRGVGVKDSGNWPGLGGILDVIDSLLFTTPAVYYFVRMNQLNFLQ